MVGAEPPPDTADEKVVRKVAARKLAASKGEKAPGGSKPGQARKRATG